MAGQFFSRASILDLSLTPNAVPPMQTAQPYGGFDIVLLDAQSWRDQLDAWTAYGREVHSRESFVAKYGRKSSLPPADQARWKKRNPIPLTVVAQ